MSLWNLVKRPAWAGFRTVSQLSLALNRDRYRYIFILGHMRSGSTLLAHILASHAGFAGAGESHISYRTPADLEKLVLKTSEMLHRPILRETYIVDQINHSYLTDDALGASSLFKCIVLMRQPEATLKSMMSLSIWPEQQALEIYVERLQTLTHYASLLRERAALVDYDHLVGHAEATLHALTGFLHLSSPLARNYATHRMTARVAGFGDPSPNIKTGQVIRTPKHDIVIGEETLAIAVRAFGKCRRDLKSMIVRVPTCTPFPDTDGIASIIDRGPI